MKNLLPILILLLSFFSLYAKAQNEFITTWETTAASESITIPTNSAETYNYAVDWGDGSALETGITSDATHTYATAGAHTVKISGVFPQIYFNNSGDKLKIQTIEQWGNIQWTSMRYAFNGCSNLTYNATDAPDLSNVTSLRFMFSGCSSFNGDINNWDVSSITDLYATFNKCYAFNQDLNLWNVGNVTTMQETFADASSFNADISTWDVSNVSMMFRAFYRAFAFNSDISQWTTSSLTRLDQAFYRAESFNQNLSGWEMGSVTSLSFAFQNASSFNQNLASWDISSCTDFRFMFDDSGMSTSNYDQTLIGWAAQTVQPSVTLGAGGISYCNASSAHTTLTSSPNNWTINDAGADCSSIYFITTWQTSDGEITIPTNDESGTLTYNYDISWTNLTTSGAGDGSASAQTGDYTITGLTNGDTYQVEISGDFPRIYFNGNADKDKIMTIEQWGEIEWISMEKAFSECSNLTHNATDSPDLSSVTNLSQMFYLANSIQGDITGWNVSNITNMNNLFSNTDFNQDISSWDVSSVTVLSFTFRGTPFNQDISNWDVSNVVSMRGTFDNASSFNQDISAWDVSNVNSMIWMFYRAFDFNQPIGSWDVANVNTMREMFFLATAFNQNLNGWDVSNVSNMSSMFQSASSFNQDLNSWDVSAVTDMNRMFFGATNFNGVISDWNVSNVTNMKSLFSSSAFNQAIGNWDVSNVTNMNSMFSGLTNFNHDLSSWDVSNVTDMNSMFGNADSFNQDISSWDVSNVTTMRQMFFRASSFNQDLSIWDVSAVVDFARMFDGAEGFNQDIGSWDISSAVSTFEMFENALLFNQDLSSWNVSNVTTMSKMFDNCGMSVDNYDLTLIGWADQTLQNEVTLGANGLVYCNGEDARNILTDAPNNWIITGDGSDCTNANSYPTAIALSNASLDENNAAGAVIGTVSSTDADGGDTFTYSLVAGTGDTDNSSFSFSADELQAAASFDFETQSTYTVRVRTTDNKGGIFEGIFNISVNDVSESPTAITLSPATVAENNSIGDLVSTLSTTDPDAGETYSYSLVAGMGDSDNASFSIREDELIAEAVFDFETEASVNIRVETNDGNGNAYSEILIITITDLDESNNSTPTDLALSSSAINESNAVDAVVGNFSTTDADGADTHSYSLAAGRGDTDNASFAVVGTELQALAVFDFESKESYSIRVQSNDGEGGKVSKELTITINDVNEAPTSISLSSNTGEENNAVGDVIGAFSTIDPDVGDMHNFSLVAGAGDADNGSFAISGSDLQANEVFDFETKSSFSIRVASTDVDGATLEKAFTVSIFDVNEAPTALTLSTSSLEENNTVGAQIGSLNTTDEDSNDTHSYNLVAGTGDTDNASFAIDGSELEASEVFNFEIKSSYSIRVESTDSDGNIVEENFSITITDVNEAPTALSLSTTEIAEQNELGSSIGVLTSLDEDTEDSHAYSLVSGAGDADNASFNITNDELTAAEVFDFESKSSYSIRVQTDDGNGGTYEESFSISITDGNEAPIALSLSNNEINENNEIGDVVGNLVTTDVNSADTHTYALVAGEGDTDNSSFSISGSDLKSAVAFDFETQNTYSIRVATTDEAGASFEQSFEISITDVEEKQEQTITIEPVEDVIATAADFEIIATTTSELALNYAVLLGPATIAGSTVSLTGETGTVQIEVSQGGNENYLPATATLSFEVVEDPCSEFVATAVVVQNVSCNGESSGSFSVNPTAGTGPFTYTMGEESQATGTFENLPAGSYEVSVTDANGCTATTSVEISEPAAITATAETTDSNSIYGNGSISLSVTGGTGNYTFEWSNGETAANLSDLEIGEYSVIVTDEAGCSITESYTIGGVTAISDAFELQMYPNPVLNQLEIRHAEGVVQISMIDAMGRILSQYPTTGKSTRIEMGHMPAGVYFIRLDNGRVHRIIKK